MSDYLGAILSSICLIYFSYIGYLVWFKPAQYKNVITKRRYKLNKQLPFLPDGFKNFLFDYDNSQFSFWWVRIGLLFLILICIVGLFVSIFGPL